MFNRIIWLALLYSVVRGATSIETVTCRERNYMMLMGDQDYDVETIHVNHKEELTVFAGNWRDENGNLRGYVSVRADCIDYNIYECFNFEIRGIAIQRLNALVIGYAAVGFDDDGKEIHFLGTFAENTNIYAYTHHNDADDQLAPKGVLVPNSFEMSIALGEKTIRAFHWGG